MAVNLAYTPAQQAFRAEVRAWMEANVPGHKLQTLEGERYNYESWWADVARRINPNSNIFTRPLGGIAPAERRDQYIFESTPVQALDTFAAVMMMILILEKMNRRRFT